MPLPPRTPIAPEGPVRRKLRIRHMMLLAALGRARSLHRAARQLKVTQPGASKLLNEIERMFGVTLFTRSTRGVTPTPFGEILIRRSDTILAEIDNAEDELEAWAEGGRGRIRVGVLPVAIPELMLGALMEMFARHPNVIVSIEEGASETLMPALRRGDLDCLLGRVPQGRDTSDLTCIPLYEEGICIVAGRHHRLARKRRPQPADLTREEWILPHAEALLMHAIDGTFARKGLPPPAARIESSSFIAIEALLRRTDLLSIWPASLARDYADRGLLTILPIPLEQTLPPVGILLRPSADRPPFLKNFLNAVESVAANLKNPPRSGTAPRRRGPLAAT